MDAIINIFLLSLVAGLGSGIGGPEVVSRIVQQAMETAKPKARYLAGIPFLNRLALYLGDSVKDFIFKRV